MTTSNSQHLQFRFQGRLDRQLHWKVQQITISEYQESISLTHQRHRQVTPCRRTTDGINIKPDVVAQCDRLILEITNALARRGSRQNIQAIRLAARPDARTGRGRAAFIYIDDDAGASGGGRDRRVYALNLTRNRNPSPELLAVHGGRYGPAAEDPRRRIDIGARDDGASVHFSKRIPDRRGPEAHGGTGALLSY